MGAKPWERPAKRTRVKEAELKRWGLFLAMLLSVTVVLFPKVSGADEKISGRFVYHNLKVETVEVGDVPGHITGFSQNAGLVFYSNGEIATHTATNTLDFVNGKGTHTVNRVFNYSDGSTIFVKGIGTTTPVDGGKKSVHEGTYEYTGGTGRFERIGGKGTYKGERLGSPKTGSDTYIDFTGTEWKK
jgi:hypothetical protein